jgi:hypothetical protein
MLYLPIALSLSELAQAGIKLDVLKCPGDTQDGNFVRLKGGEIFLTVKHGALIGMIEAIDAVEKTGLSSIIRADNGKYFAITYIEIYAVQGLQSTEGKGEIGDA